MKKKLFKIGAILAFWVKDSLFLFFFIFTLPVFANSISVKNIDTEEFPIIYENDSISNISASLEIVKIYVSPGTIIYNADEISKNVEIIQNESIIKKDVVKPNNLSQPKKASKLKVQKAKKQENTYTSNIQFKQLPFESNTIFSKSGRDIVTLPSTNPQFKMLALLECSNNNFFITKKQKFTSRYSLNFSGNFCLWQMHIRPPPVVNISQLGIGIHS
ncbi:hypothetical protein [Epilithonimonas sp. UC225_85]|uniref:hypothetical protein n=1 Tax=Epilithonimonas sp. UC225_85 TaxID=3350167 RepID=UPI0036D2F55C